MNGYKDRLLGSFVDRYKKDEGLEPIDVVMLTLDAVTFLDRCLFSVYREIPVKRLLVCDGGSKDGTIETLKKYPRVQIYIRPDIRTLGKAAEFLFSLLETEWFLMIDSDIELPLGWYDEMCKYKDEYDVLECAERILTYHFCREVRPSRPSDNCYLGRKEAIKGFVCDDDYIWRIVDFYFRQQVEKFGYRYGKVPVYRVHHEAERVPYGSDEEKKFSVMVFKDPKWIITDKEKWKRFMKKYAMGVVKYLDPEFSLVKRDRGFDKAIAMLDRDWVKSNGSKWLKRYDKATSLKARLKLKIFAMLIFLRRKYNALREG